MAATSLADMAKRAGSDKKRNNHKGLDPLSFYGCIAKRLLLWEIPAGAVITPPILIMNATKTAEYCIFKNQ